MLAAGCAGILHKPFQETDLMTIMQTHLDIQFITSGKSAANHAPDQPALPGSAPASHDSSSHIVLPLAALPSDILARLEHATIIGDAGELYQLLTHVRTCDVTAANSLALLVDQFAYPEILMLIETARKQK
jgi:hypothetical protein